MSATRIQRLNALLKRVEERRAQPRLAAVPSPISAAQPAKAEAAPAPAPAPEAELFAPTAPPAAPTVAPAPVSLPPARAPSLRPDTADAGRRTPSASPLEDAMAQLGGEREDSGPLHVAPPAAARASEPMPMPINQDLVLTHRPEAGPHDALGPIVELVQPKSPTGREPTIQFDTGVKANPLTQRDLKPVITELGAEPAPTAPTHKLEPAPFSAASPVRAVSSVRDEQPKSFGELLELSLALRPLR